MKKSEQYKMAQLAVLASHIPDRDKLEIVKTLMANEDLAIWSEKAEAEKE